MPLEQQLVQTQKLILTQTMQLSLRCLQMTALELRSYVEEAALSNPLLDVVEQPLGDLTPEAVDTSGAEAGEALPIERRDQMIWDMSRGEGEQFTSFTSHPGSFSDYLNEQLGQMRLLDEDMLARCRYLVGCLNSAGYLDCPLQELAEELGRSLFDMEQALFIVQSLDPPGVGARSLSECLLLQLAESSAFTEVNIHLVRSGLPLLAEGDMKGLADLLGVSPAAARQAAATIRGLNPVPSRGFYTEEHVPYAVPEATIRCDQGHVFIEIDQRLLPKVTLNEGYCAMLKETDDPNARLYLQEKRAEARALITSLDSRADTLYRLLSAVVQIQRDSFTKGAELQPMTMRQVADQLELNVSTVSRAVKDKYIQCNGKVVPLRSLFTVALPSGDGQSVSSAAVRTQLRRFIDAEPHDAPLSDEALCGALTGAGLHISRRTVAKYRGELGIPAASARKRAYAEKDDPSDPVRSGSPGGKSGS